MSVPVRQYLDFLTGPGRWSPIAAAAILGHSEQESGFNPRAVNADEGAEGMMQWRLDRREAMRRHVANSSLPLALAQLDFLSKEADQHKGLRERMNSAKTTDEAVQIFGKEYVRPKVIEQIRFSNAKNIYAGFADPDYRGARGMTAGRAVASDARVTVQPQDRALVDDLLGVTAKPTKPAKPDAGVTATSQDRALVDELLGTAPAHPPKPPPAPPPEKPKEMGFTARMAEGAAGLLDQVNAAKQGTTPVTRDLTGGGPYGQPLGSFVPRDVSETKTDEVWTPDRKVVRFDPKTMVAIRREGSNDYQVFPRTPDTDEGALSRLGRLLGIGTIAGSNMARPAAQYAPTKADELMDAFRISGVDPSLPDVTKNRFVGGYLQMLRNSLLGGGVGRQMDQRVQQSGDALARLQAGLGGARTPQTAGEALQGGLANFVRRNADVAADIATPAAVPSRDVGFFNKYGRFFDKTIGRADQNAPVTPTNTRSALETITGGFTNPAVGDAVVPGEFGRLRAALTDPGTPTSLHDLRALRTAQGEKLDGVKIAGANTAQGQTKLLYGALKDDINTELGRQGLAHGAHRADQLYAAGQRRIDELRPLLDAKSNEQAFERFWTATREGGGGDVALVNAVKRSLPAERWDTLRSGILGRLGQTKAGAVDLNETGRFSPATFATNWASLPQKSKDALFGTQTELRRSLDALGRVSSAQKRLERLANTSNTFNQGLVLAQTTGALGAGYQALQGNVWPMVGLAAAHIGANRAGALMMNPKFVRWVTATGQPWPIPAVTKHLQTLKAMGARDETVAAFHDALWQEIEANR